MNGYMNMLMAFKFDSNYFSNVNNIIKIKN